MEQSIEHIMQCPNCICSCTQEDLINVSDYAKNVARLWAEIIEAKSRQSVIITDFELLICLFMICYICFSSYIYFIALVLYVYIVSCIHVP